MVSPSGQNHDCKTEYQKNIEYNTAQQCADAIADRKRIDTAIGINQNQMHYNCFTAEQLQQMLKK